MKRFLLLSLIAISLLSSFSAFAQTPIITMATSNSTVNLNIYWTGTGKVYANGSSLPSYTNTTVKVVNEKVEVTSSGDTQILQVYCNKNNLTSLDISNCPTIQNLDCSSNNLTSIDISKNVLLYQLNCYENQITSIDITKNTRMQYLSCSDNKLSSLLTTNITKLERLISSENPISSIDVSTNTNLIELNLMYCNLSDLKLSHFSSNIEKLDLSYNPLKTISLENLPNLKNFSCIGYIINKTLTDIDLSFNTKLQTLNVNTQLLKKLDISKNLELSILNCANNQITSLDISKNSNLVNLYADNQNITLPDIAITENTYSANSLISCNGFINNTIYYPYGNFNTLKNNIFTWEDILHNSGKSGRLYYEFETELPQTITGNSFKGAIYQWYVLNLPTNTVNPQKEKLEIFSNESGIVISGLENNSIISVYNTTGTLIYNSSVSTNSTNIEVIAGIYLVKIGNQTFKVIKK